MMHRSDRWSDRVDLRVPTWRGRDAFTGPESSTPPTGSARRALARSGQRVSRRQVVQLERDLSARDVAVLRDVARYHFLTTSQLQTLHFQGHASDQAAGRICRRVLARLADLRVVEPLERRVGGIRAGSASYVWRVGVVGDRLLRQAETRRGRRKEPSARFLGHTLAVADCYCALVAAARAGLIELLRAEPEPGSWRRYLGPGGSPEILKPDLVAVTASGDYEDHWFCEIDQATESLPTLLKKCAQYERYRRSGQEQHTSGVFPRVVWVVPTDQRGERLWAAVTRSDLDADLFRITTPAGFLAVIGAGAS